VWFFRFAALSTIKVPLSAQSGESSYSRTSLAQVTSGSAAFRTGSQVDVAALAARARDAGARMVVDVTQMAGAAPVTMTRWGVDALVCSGYKCLLVLRARPSVNPGAFP
jgi:selenocysteine lyase/cysteine desulfurase